MGDATTHGRRVPTVRLPDDQSAALSPAFIRFMNVCELAWMLHASQQAPEHISFDPRAEAVFRRLIEKPPARAW
jgi:hypothetical protein